MGAFILCFSLPLRGVEFRVELKEATITLKVATGSQEITLCQR